MSEIGKFLGHFIVSEEGAEPAQDWKGEWDDAHAAIVDADKSKGAVAHSIGEQLDGGRRVAAFHVYIRAFRPDGTEELSVCDCACPTDEEGVIHAGVVKP